MTSQLTLFDQLKLTELQRDILNIIQAHKGKDNAIRMRDLAAQVNKHPRIVQSVVKELRHECKIPIGTGCGRSPGYFLIRNKQEAWEVAQHFWHRGISNLREHAFLIRLFKAKQIDAEQLKAL